MRIWLAPYTGGMCRLPRFTPRSAFLNSSESTVMRITPSTDPLTDPIPPTTSIVMMLNVCTKKNDFGGRSR